MGQYSTREAAKRLGLSLMTIQRYIAAKKIPAPPVQSLGGGEFRIWSDKDIERVREILPKIANGRKTRYQKLRQQEEKKKKGSSAKKKK